MEKFRNIEYDYATADDVFIIRGLQANQIVDAVTTLEEAVEDLEGSGGGSQDYEINKQTGNSYTFVLTDAHKVVEMNYQIGGMQMSIPPNSSVAFPIGTRIRIVNTGGSNANVYDGVGVTLHSLAYNAPAIVPKGTAEIIKIDTDIWMITGDLTNDA